MAETRYERRYNAERNISTVIVIILIATILAIILWYFTRPIEITETEQAGTIIEQVPVDSPNVQVRETIIDSRSGQEVEVPAKDPEGGAQY